MAGAWKHRLDMLRGMELEAYQLAYHIVQEERKAVEIVKAAMIIFGRGEDMLQASEETRRQQMRKTVMKCSLPVIQSHMQHRRRERESRLG